MSRLVVLVVVLGPAIAALVAARDPSPLRGARRAVLYGLGFFVAYLFGLLVIYPRV